MSVTKEANRWTGKGFMVIWPPDGRAAVMFMERWSRQAGVALRDSGARRISIDRTFRSAGRDLSFLSDYGEQIDALAIENEESLDTGVLYDLPALKRLTLVGPAASEVDFSRLRTLETCLLARRAGPRSMSSSV